MARPSFAVAFALSRYRPVLDLGFLVLQSRLAPAEHPDSVGCPISACRPKTTCRATFLPGPYMNAHLRYLGRHICTRGQAPRLAELPAGLSRLISW